MNRAHNTNPDHSPAFGAPVRPGTFLAFLPALADALVLVMEPRSFATSELRLRASRMRWSLKGVWWRIFEAMSDDPDFEYLIVDSTIVRAHQPLPGSKKGSEDQAIGRSRGRLSTKIHMAVRGLRCPVRFKLGQTIRPYAPEHDSKLLELREAHPNLPRRAIAEILTEAFGIERNAHGVHVRLILLTAAPDEPFAMAS
jgi:hypothetical protein